MVKLPAQLEQNTLRDMRVGDEAWTVPWAMHADENGELFLDVNFTQDARPGGTVQMKVKRTHEGYEADVTQCGYFGGWRKGDKGGDAVPVLKLIY